MLRGALFVLAAVCIATAAATKAADDDLIKFLPGLDKQPDFKQYSGYIQVEDRFYHYWMLESQSNPSNDPVVLWLTGGPGCSMGIAALRENGPFTPSQDKPLHLDVNPYAWNLNATMLYVDSPAPVGFSYGGNNTAGDDSVAYDNYHVLLGFFERFPHLATLEFYITGESYAGQYIPQLAHKILEENAAGVNPKLNFKGFMVGNPSGISSSEWEFSSYKFYEAHGILSTDEVAQIAQVCNFSTNSIDDACQEIQEQTWQRNLKGVDPYNILAPCIGDGPGEQPGCFTERLAALAEAGNDIINGQTFVPCGDYNRSIAYFNHPDVKAALHISPKAYAWSPCSEHLNYVQYKPGTPQLYLDMVGKIKMMVYSGDIDSCVPFLGTRRGVENLRLARKSPYRPWFAYDPSTKSSQIAGYIEEFDGVSFATVRGAGHMVPADRPPAALTLLNAFIHPSTSPLPMKGF